jgi:hypothetical protein
MFVRVCVCVRVCVRVRVRVRVRVCVCVCVCVEPKLYAFISMCFQNDPILYLYRG